MHSLSDFLLALHYFCFPRTQICESHLGFEGKYVTCFQQKEFGRRRVCVLLQVSQSINDKAHLTSLLQEGELGWPGGGTGQYKTASSSVIPEQQII